jgi:hypothetical protein
VVVHQLGLSLDEGAVLSDSMLDDAAVQVVAHFLQPTFKNALPVCGVALLTSHFAFESGCFCNIYIG